MLYQDEVPALCQYGQQPAEQLHQVFLQTGFLQFVFRQDSQESAETPLIVCHSAGALQHSQRLAMRVSLRDFVKRAAGASNHNHTVAGSESL